MEIGSTIKKIRTDNNIKQFQFANKIGISQTYLSQIENNKRRPNFIVLEKIGDALGTPLPVLLFLSLDENDVSQEKQEIFNTVNPMIKEFIKNIYL